MIKYSACCMQLRNSKTNNAYILCPKDIFCFDTRHYSWVVLAKCLNIPCKSFGNGIIICADKVNNSVYNNYCALIFYLHAVAGVGPTPLIAWRTVTDQYLVDAFYMDAEAPISIRYIIHPEKALKDTLLFSDRSLAFSLNQLLLRAFDTIYENNIVWQLRGLSECCDIYSKLLFQYYNRNKYEFPSERASDTFDLTSQLILLIGLNKNHKALLAERLKDIRKEFILQNIKVTEVYDEIRDLRNKFTHSSQVPYSGVKNLETRLNTRDIRELCARMLWYLHDLLVYTIDALVRRKTRFGLLESLIATLPSRNYQATYEILFNIVGDLWLTFDSPSWNEFVKTYLSQGDNKVDRIMPS